MGGVVSWPVPEHVYDGHQGSVPPPTENDLVLVWHPLRSTDQQAERVRRPRWVAGHPLAIARVALKEQLDSIDINVRDGAQR